ncbi:hypothetical protein PAMP_013031 [Pampus punctatissimus]
MVGTDFSMICQLFPHRARSEIKNKFKKEERENAWRIDKAFSKRSGLVHFILALFLSFLPTISTLTASGFVGERHKLDIEYFSKLLEKILEVQKNRKKLKSLSEKNSPRKRKRKTKGKKAAKKLSDVDEEDEEEEGELPDLEEEEEEGEKENEDLCNEGATPVSKPKRKRKRKNEEEASTEEPNDKKKTSEKSNEQGEPEDAEETHPEDRTNSDMSDKTEIPNAVKDAAIKPAKLSRGRAPKPLLPLGRKWSKKHPAASTKAKDNASDKGDESVSDGVSKEQVNKETSPSRQENERKSANDGIFSEDEDYTVQPPRPTRYGRVPKPTKHLNYVAKEDSSASESPPASPARSDAKPKATKRGKPSKSQSAQESKKPKLVTLRASQSDYSDEEDDNQMEETEVEEQWPVCSSSKDSSAPVFVPATLRSPHPGISEVEETIEELDILANMPDVLGISQDALCHDASCERAQSETGTAEPCEHQLDLLVDVIDFLSSEHTEVSADESYNEAAQTLLTIGNLAHLPQSAPTQTTTQDHSTGITLVSVNETSQHLEEDTVAQEELSAAPSVSAASDHEETSETVATLEPQNSATDKEPLSQTGDRSIIKTSEQKNVSDTDTTPQLQSSTEISKNDLPQTRRGRLSKVKPKPNLGRASRTALSKSLPDTSTAEKADETQTAAPDLSQDTETLSTSEETTLKLAECSPASIKDDVSSENLNQSLSGAQFEPGWEPASRDTRSIDEKLISNAGIIESGCNNPATSNTDLATVQESSDRTSVTPAEEMPICQKEESELTSTSHTRKSRFQKVKPKLPQTSRTARSKPQTTNDAVEKDTSVPSNLESTRQVETIAEIESQPSCTTSPEKPSQSTSVLPSLNLGCTPTPAEDLSLTEDKKTDVGPFDQMDSDATTLDQSDPEAQFKPSWKQATGDMESTSESTEERLMSHAETTASSCNNPATADSAITESQVGQEEEGGDRPAAPVEELPIGQKEESEIVSTCQTRRSRLQKVKPNLPQTSRTVRSKPQTTKEPESTDKTVAEVEPQPTCSTSPEKLQSTAAASVLIPSLELGSTHESTDDLCSAKTELDTSSECSKQNMPHIRRRFAKATPNLGSSTRTTQSNVTSEQQPVDNKSAQTKLEPTEKDGKHLTSPHSEQSLSSTDAKGSSTNSIVIATSSVAESQSLSTDLTAENKSGEKPTVEEESTGDDASSHNKAEASKDGSTESKIKSVLPANLQSAPDPKENTQQQHSEIKSQEFVQQGSETVEATPATNSKSQDPKCTDETRSSIKSPQARRGRLIKPKPNLGRSSRPPQPQQVQNATQAEKDSGSCSGVHVTEIQADIQEPVEETNERLSNKEPPPNDAEVSSGCVTQAPESQVASTSSTCESITIFPDMLSVPSDPDEPFFILSLTEIPVCFSGEAGDSVSEPPPYLPVTDASIQQQSSDPGESVAAGGHVAPSDVLEPVSTEETGETGLINVNDIEPEPFAYTSESKENPVDPHESTRVQLPQLPDTVEKSEETNIPPTKQRLTGPGRRAKLQVKPSITRKEQASKTLATKEAELIPIQANTTQDSECPGPSVQPESSKTKAGEEVVTDPQKGSDDNIDTEKETVRKNPEDSGTGAQDRATSSRNRRPKGFLSFLSETDSTAPSSDRPRGKAKVKTTRKRLTPAPVASTSRNVAPATSLTQTPEHPRSASSPTSPSQTQVDVASECTAEISVSQQSECVESSSVEEEPTSVSQYFLSDIFTEVEEG